MAILLPFSYVAKYGKTDKIKAEEEDLFWINAVDTLNNLVTRCNTKNATSITQVTPPITTESKKNSLSAEDYDENITKLEDVCNALIAASGNQHVNPANTMTLHKRSVLNRPLFVHERDTNCSTLQVFINSLDELYKLV